MTSLEKALHALNTGLAGSHASFRGFVKLLLPVGSPGDWGKVGKGYLFSMQPREAEMRAAQSSVQSDE